MLPDFAPTENSLLVTPKANLGDTNFWWLTQKQTTLNHTVKKLSLFDSACMLPAVSCLGLTYLLPLCSEPESIMPFSSSLPPPSSEQWQLHSTWGILCVWQCLKYLKAFIDIGWLNVQDSMKRQIITPTLHIKKWMHRKLMLLTITPLWSGRTRIHIYVESQGMCPPPPGIVCLFVFRLSVTGVAINLRLQVLDHWLLPEAPVLLFLLKQALS